MPRIRLAQTTEKHQTRSIFTTMEAQAIDFKGLKKEGLQISGIRTELAQQMQ
ncbi:hypothetical protein [Pseudomonas sp. PS02288]|uniref:hypothetical protein n=1 Tax=Pseudomonas sp. PS02288 TaxID=2991443 RepID=UPI00249ACD9C|nr:hypothetical protein [Pseudomonas sp. PS02288]